VKYLLDVNVLLAALWTNHPHHRRAFAWLAEKRVIVCPLVELGYIRISTSPKVFNAPMVKSRELLGKFVQERKAERIADDLPALESSPKKSELVTDTYLADLALKHGAKLATLDTGIKHPAVALID
jgi:toxin-antitoxin system PIN domain toxin